LRKLLFFLEEKYGAALFLCCLLTETGAKRQEVSDFIEECLAGETGRRGLARVVYLIR
jgi:hypothetical protein